LSKNKWGGRILRGKKPATLLEVKRKNQRRGVFTRFREKKGAKREEKEKVV